MRILSKFNRLKVIIMVGILVGMPCYFFTGWVRQQSQERLHLIEEYKVAHHCKLLGYTKRGASPVYECEGIQVHASDIQEALALNAR